MELHSSVVFHKLFYTLVYLCYGFTVDNLKQKGFTMNGGKLHDLCEERGITLWTLIKDNGLPQSTLYAMANGQNNIEGARIDLFFKIAHALNMTVDELIDALGGFDEE